MPVTSTDQTAEQELRNLQALALSLQGITPEYARVVEGSEEEQMARQIQQLDALDSELAAFERRFASADPEVKRMLAHMLSQDVSNPEFLVCGDDLPAEPCHLVGTPASSDSAQTFPTALGVQHAQNHSAISSSGGGDNRCVPQVAMPITSSAEAPQPSLSTPCLPSSTWETAKNRKDHQATDESMSVDLQTNVCAASFGEETVSAAMFPAVTPANSLAQQAVQRDTLSDCAASLPMPTSNPPGVKDTILANQLRHRLHDMEHDVPRISGNIRDTLTHISLEDPSFSSSTDQT